MIPRATARLKFCAAVVRGEPLSAESTSIRPTGSVRPHPETTDHVNRGGKGLCCRGEMDGVTNPSTGLQTRWSLSIRGTHNEPVVDVENIDQRLGRSGYYIPIDRLVLPSNHVDIRSAKGRRHLNRLVANRGPIMKPNSLM